MENNTETVEYTEDVETTELATTADNQIMAGLYAESSSAIESYGFDTDTAEGVARVFNAGSDAESLNDSGLTEITINGIQIKPGVRVDPVSGNRTPCANTMFFAVDGKFYITQSTGIAHDAARLLALISKIGWGEGVKIRIVATKLAGGRTLKKLALA